MKSVLKVLNMKTSADINAIREAIAQNEGVIACQITKEKQEVSIVYDRYFLSEDKLIQCLEDLGYTVV